MMRKDRSESKRGFTVEVLLYVLSFGLALALRFFALGRWPLLDGEAGLGLAAWRFAHSLPATLRGHSPLLFNVNALSFFLTDGSDGLLRLWGVLTGAFLVLLPYGLRRWVGKLGAVTTSFLLAISPSFVYFSRIADGSIVVAFCALGLLVALVGYLAERHPAYVLVMAALLALGLLSSPLVYTLLAMAATFPLFLRLRSRWAKDSTALEELRQAWRDLLADSRSWRVALLLAGVLFLMFGVGFFANPSGLQMTLDQFGQWFGSLQLLRGTPWYRNLQVLLLYEAMPLLVGAAGFFVTRMRRDTPALLLRYWVVFTFVFAILPGYRAPHSVLLVLLPLILAAGQAVESLREELAVSGKAPLFWALIALSLAIFAAAYGQLVSYLGLPVSTYLLRIAALFVFLIAAHAMLWSVYGPTIPARAAIASFTLLLLLITIRAEVRLNYVRARDPVEPIVGTTTPPDVLDLVRYAAQWSSQMLGDPRVMDFQIDEKLQVPLGWYLRSFPQVSYISRTPPATEAAALILPAQAPAPARCVGMRFALHSTWAGGKHSLQDWLRWWVDYRSTLKGQAADEVIFWVRTPQE